MRRFREICPHWETLPTDQLLQQVGFATLNALMPRIADWYQVNLPMWAVLYHVGYRDTGRRLPREPYHPLIDQDTPTKQVSCMLPSHGSQDVKLSAKYYLFDRNELTEYGHIYCYGPNCGKAYTSFWYLYVMLKFHRKATFSDTILYIETEFKLPFPRNLILDADPDRLTDEEEAQAKEREIARRFAQAQLLREQERPRDPAQYLAALARLYTSPLQCMAVER